MLNFASRLLLNCKIVDLKLCCIRCIQTLQDPQPLTVSYLTNSCGLPLEKAIHATKYVNIYKTDRPDMVLQLLRSHGFTKSQIARLISKHPPCILADPEKTLKPKIEFFESLGIAKHDIPRILCGSGQILSTSLKNKLLPTVDFLRGILESEDKVICALKQWPRILSRGTAAMMANIETLRAHGVLESGIRSLLLLAPRSLLFSVDLFTQLVHEVKEMGFQPATNGFIYALRTMSVMSKSNWERKKKLLMSFGWSESDFLLAFRSQPFFMLTSEKKMKIAMEYFLSKLCMESSDIVKCPNLFLASLERRIIPRWSVLELLSSKGLITKTASFVWLLNMRKEEFEKKYITCFKRDYPELIKAYKIPNIQKPNAAHDAMKEALKTRNT